MVEDEHCATADSVKLLDGKLSALLALLADPDPAPGSAPGQAEAEEEDTEALREALEDAQFEAASLQRGNDALQAALESATALLSTARAEAAAMRHSLSTAEESAALELQVCAPPARRARLVAPGSAAVTTASERPNVQLTRLPFGATGRTPRRSCRHRRGGDPARRKGAAGEDVDAGAHSQRACGAAAGVAQGDRGGKASCVAPRLL